MMTVSLIETLRAANPKQAAAFELLKSTLQGQLQTRWCSRWPEGNDHGPDHIDRVLKNLASLLGHAPLAAGRVISSLELFLSMTSALAHDMGIIDGRANHARASSQLIAKLAKSNQILFNEYQTAVLQAAIECHSSTQKIEDRCAQFAIVESFGGEKVRPRFVAALLRLADELDEDYRRAEQWLSQLVNVPTDSEPFWRFSQRIQGVDIGPVGQNIVFNVVFRDEDRLPVVAAGTPWPSFLHFFASKIAKLNAEREYVRQFLGDEIARSFLVVSVRPLEGYARWKTPRAFIFPQGDWEDAAARAESAKSFVKAFPEFEPNAGLSIQRVTDVANAASGRSSQSPFDAASVQSPFAPDDALLLLRPNALQPIAFVIHRALSQGRGRTHPTLRLSTHSGPTPVVHQGSRPRAHEWADLANLVVRLPPHLTEFVLGRGDDCQVLLDEPDASRRHAKLIKENDVWSLIDLGSHNGTHLGGRRLGPEACLVRCYDDVTDIDRTSEITVGSTVARLVSGLAFERALVTSIVPLVRASRKRGSSRADPFDFLAPGTKALVESIISMLESPDTAPEANRAIEALLATLRDTDGDIDIAGDMKVEAIACLQRIGRTHSPVLPALVECLEQPDPRIVRRAFHALTEVATAKRLPEGVYPLTERILSEDPPESIAVAAIACLATAPALTGEVLATVVRHVSDTRHQVSQSAIFALRGRRVDGKDLPEHLFVGLASALSIRLENEGAQDVLFHLASGREFPPALVAGVVSGLEQAPVDDRRGAFFKVAILHWDLPIWAAVLLPGLTAHDANLVGYALRGISSRDTPSGPGRAAPVAVVQAVLQLATRGTAVELRRNAYQALPALWHSDYSGGMLDVLAEGLLEMEVSLDSLGALEQLVRSAYAASVVRKAMVTDPPGKLPRSLQLIMEGGTSGGGGATAEGIRERAEVLLQGFGK